MRAGHASLNAALQRELGRRPRSRTQALAWLTGRGTPAAEAESLVAEMESAGLIDDRRLARLWVEDRHQRKGYGPYRLERELREQGIAAETAAEALDAVFADREATLERLQSMIEQRFAPLVAGPGPAGARKLRERLLRLGYGGELLGEVLRRCRRGDDGEGW